MAVSHPSAIWPSLLAKPELHESESWPVVGLQTVVALG
jgi:hypothetical protein